MDATPRQKTVPKWRFEGTEWVRIDGARLSQDTLKSFEKENHAILRGIAGQQRLDLCMESLEVPSSKPAKPAIGVPPPEPVDASMPFEGKPPVYPPLPVDPTLCGLCHKSIASCNCQPNPASETRDRDKDVVYMQRGMLKMLMALALDKIPDEHLDYFVKRVRD